MSELEPPKDVRLVHEDGDSIGLEVVYDGRDGQGVHIWSVTANASVLMRGGWRIECAAMPPHTALVLDVTHDHP